MAKLNAPLFSFAASGKIANALVYFGWKGINVVRQYVVPANPKTALQTTHRDYLKAAVAEIHAAQSRAANPLNAADTVAYAALGSTRKTPRTWFNEIVKMWLDVMVAGKTPCIYSGGEVTDKDVSALDVFMKLNEETGSDLAAGKFYFGTTKTALINSKAATVTAGDKVVLVDEDCSAFLTAGIKYFWQFKPDAGDPCVGANSGIYYFIAE